LLGSYFNGEIGASNFTELAADAVFRSCSHDLFLVVEFENRLGAEFDADAAALAPLSVDEVFF
jgi:hypothetical protein